MAYVTSGHLVTTTQQNDYEATELLFTGTIATNTQIDITVYQDESGGTTADSSEQITDVQDGQMYSLSNFISSSGATYWARFDLSTTDDSNSPEVDALSVSLTTVESASISKGAGQLLSANSTGTSMTDGSVVAGEASASGGTSTAVADGGAAMVTGTATLSPMVESASALGGATVLSSAAASQSADTDGTIVESPTLSTSQGPTIAATSTSSSSDDASAVASQTGGYALSFDVGENNNFNQRVELSDPVDYSGEFTLSLWLNMDGGADGLSVGPSRRAVFDDNVIYLDQKRNEIVACRIEGSGVSVGDVNDSAYLFDGLRHLIIRYDGTELQLIRDTNVLDSESLGSVPAPTDPPWIAGNSEDDRRHWPGVLDDIRIYDRALSDSEVQDLYSGRHVSDGLVGWWPFDDNVGSTGTTELGQGSLGEQSFNSSGGSLTDQSGNGNDGLLVNGPEWTAPISAYRPNSISTETASAAETATATPALAADMVSDEIRKAGVEATLSVGSASSVAPSTTASTTESASVIASTTTAGMVSGASEENSSADDIASIVESTAAQQSASSVSVADGGATISALQTDAVAAGDVASSMGGASVTPATALSSQMAESTAADESALMLSSASGPLSVDATSSTTETPTISTSQGTSTEPTTSSSSTDDASPVASQTGGYALEFDGDNDEVSVPDNSELDITDEITICAWVNPFSAPNQDQDIFGKTTAYGFHIYQGPDDDGSNGTAYTDIWIDGSRINPNGPPLPQNEKTHILATYDGSSVSFYQNGSSWESIDASGQINTNDNPLSIGNGPLGRGPFYGVIDDVRVYNRALSDSEIQALYNGHHISGGLVGWWPLDDGYGDTAADLSGNGNDGTFVSNPEWTSPISSYRPNGVSTETTSSTDGPSITAGTASPSPMVESASALGGATVPSSTSAPQSVDASASATELPTISTSQGPTIGATTVASSSDDAVTVTSQASDINAVGTASASENPVSTTSAATATPSTNNILVRAMQSSGSGGLLSADSVAAADSSASMISGVADSSQMETTASADDSSAAVAANTSPLSTPSTASADDSSSLAIANASLLTTASTASVNDSSLAAAANTALLTTPSTASSTEAAAATSALAADIASNEISRAGDQANLSVSSGSTVAPSTTAMATESPTIIASLTTTGMVSGDSEEQTLADDIAATVQATTTRYGAATTSSADSSASLSDSVASARQMDNTASSAADAMLSQSDTLGLQTENTTSSVTEAVLSQSDALGLQTENTASSVTDALLSQSDATVSQMETLSIADDTPSSVSSDASLLTTPSTASSTSNATVTSALAADIASDEISRAGDEANLSVSSGATVVPSTTSTAIVSPTILASMTTTGMIAGNSDEQALADDIASMSQSVSSIDQVDSTTSSVDEPLITQQIASPLKTALIVPTDGEIVLVDASTFTTHDTTIYGVSRSSSDDASRQSPTSDNDNTATDGTSGQSPTDDNDNTVTVDNNDNEVLDT